MAVRDLQKLLSRYQAEVTGFDPKRSRRKTYNNLDYVVDFSKATVRKNYLENLEQGGYRTNLSEAEFEVHWNNVIQSFKEALPDFGTKGNKGVSGKGQFAFVWSPDNTKLTIMNVKDDPFSGQSTHTFLLQTRRKVQSKVFGYKGIRKGGNTNQPGVDIGHQEDLILTQLKDVFLQSIDSVIASFSSTQKDRASVIDEVAKEIYTGVSSGNIPMDMFIEVAKSIDDSGTLRMEASVGAESVKMKTIEEYIAVEFEAVALNRGEKRDLLVKATTQFREKLLPKMMSKLDKLVGQTDWTTQQASPAMDEMIDNMIETSLYKEFNTGGSRFGSKAKGKVKKVKAKSKVRKAKKYLKRTPKKPRQAKGDIRNYIQDPRGNYQSPLALTNLLDGLVSAQVEQNMGTPALNYRTGRFSESVEVTNVTPGAIRGNRQQQVTAYYTYMKRPYETFERKDKWGEFKNPRRLIDKSIRDIATNYINAKYDLRTVRV